jgi:aconitate hydratase
VEPGDRFAWSEDSTYVKQAPFFDGMTAEPPAETPSLEGLACLAKLGDSVTTDHISPAGSIKLHSPAGEYLIERGVPAHLFNSYGARRGNHEVMIRGTFGNIRLRNHLAPGTEGGFTTKDGEVMTIFEASEASMREGRGLYVIAGKEYGTGSSRDWAAKGTLLLGVRLVLAESFERIHRSNLVGMGVLPVEFVDGQNAESLGLTGAESFSLPGFREALASGFAEGKVLTAVADGREISVRVRIDTPTEAEYYRHGGVLPFVLRSLAAQS